MTRAIFFQVLEVERLVDIVVGSVKRRVISFTSRRSPSTSYDSNICQRRITTQLTGHFSHFAGHHDIQQQKIRVTSPCHIQRLQPVCCLQNRVPTLGETNRQQRGISGSSSRDEHSAAAGRVGDIPSRRGRRGIGHGQHAGLSTAIRSRRARPDRLRRQRAISMQLICGGGYSAVGVWTRGR